MTTWIGTGLLFAGYVAAVVHARAQEIPEGGHVHWIHWRILYHLVLFSLLVVATGNITNDALLAVFELHLDAIVAALAEADFVELSEAALALGGRREDSGS